MTMLRRIAPRSLLAALLVAGLAACNDTETDGTAQQAAIAPVAAPAGQNWVDVATETPEGGFLIGNPNAPVKLMEYASHTCPHCADFAAEAGEELREKYVASGVVSYELRNQIHDPMDLTMARLVRCGTEPTAVIPLAEQLWQNLGNMSAQMQANQAAMQQAMSLPESERFFALAQTLGLVDFMAARGVSSDQQRQCLSDFASIQAIADRSNKQSEELNVTGTPTFFINGRNVGTLGWQELQANLQNAGAR